VGGDKTKIGLIKNEKKGAEDKQAHGYKKYHLKALRTTVELGVSDRCVHFYPFISESEKVCAQRPAVCPFGVRLGEPTYETE
jgi:hypothetical protein